MLAGLHEATDDRRPECEELLSDIEREARLTGEWTGRDRLSPRVLDALGRVPRHLFVPPGQSEDAYRNAALPIGCGQTISQPFIVALMTDLAAPGPDDRVLEIGTGSGYQTAVLAELAARVHSIELEPALADQAARRLAELGYRNVEVRVGDGSAGWPERAPFDVVLVTAAAASVPPALVEQLAPGGRLVIPVDTDCASQQLKLLSKRADGRVEARSVLPVAFVPLRPGPAAQRGDAHAPNRSGGPSR